MGPNINRGQDTRANRSRHTTTRKTATHAKKVHAHKCASLAQAQFSSLNLIEIDFGNFGAISFSGPLTYPVITHRHPTHACERWMLPSDPTAAAERLEGQAADEASIALAIRLQQEDDESALRNRVTDGENVVQAVPVAAAQYVEGVPVHTGTSSSVRVVYRSRRGGWGSTERDVVVMAPTPLGAPPGGYWVRASYFGGATALCCCLWALLFWPVAFCVPLCPCDAEFLYRAPDGSLWYDSGQFAGYDDDY